MRTLIPLLISLLAGCTPARSPAPTEPAPTAPAAGSSSPSEPRYEPLAGADEAAAPIRTPTPPAARGDALPDRAVSQALVPEHVAARELAHYLANPLAAAPRDEVAKRPAWSSMGRFPSNPAPFGPNPPTPIRQEDLPANPGVYELMALVGDERWPEAEALARERLRADPDEALARAMLGWALTELDRVDDAEATLGSLVKAFPGYIDGWVQLGILRSNDRRVDESVDAFDHAIALRDVWEARLGRGIALCRANRFQQAEFDLWKAVELSPQDGNAYYDLAWIAAQRREPETSAYLLRFAAREPRLLAVRVCKEVLLSDYYFEPVWHEPAFRAYLAHLPTTCLVQEHNSPLTPNMPGHQAP